ncbi:uncharacterized protein SCODWIG_03540 [Saccharomycodes ludwigii]|uniref:DUF1748-domain-containing protein n=1 Tax=Saccharomycodes ludwigii TaxID=36035 RepID=A0A376BB20_9ASCO|nr:uncharacterized protein SCODWIG_03540 [Saccharomycodes ludwigii]
MTLLGKTIHIAADLVLVSTCLAGIRRNTGLTLNKDFLLQDPGFQNFVGKYLEVGETVYDYSVASASSSSSFVRK